MCSKCNNKNNHLDKIRELEFKNKDSNFTQNTKFIIMDKSHFENLI